MLAAALLLSGAVNLSGQVAELHVELSGKNNGWTDIKKDWIGEANWDHGLPGVSVLDRVADTGRLTAWLNNDVSNSAGMLGYYSPNHANLRRGFRIGARVRLVLMAEILPETPRVEFIGNISSIMPTAGAKRQRQTRIDALDWMDDAARARLQAIALQEDKQGHELFLAALGEAPTQPESVQHDEFISETYPFAFDSAHDESTTVAAEFVRIAASSLALVYMHGGTLTYESRAVRGRVTADVDTFTEGEVQLLDAAHDREGVINYIQLLARPRELGATATDVLWQLNNAIKIVPGQVVDPVMGPYVDPTGRAKRVGGTDMVTPVSGTDFVANSAEDGSGSVLTANLSVTASIGANGVRFRLVNTGGADLWVTTLQVRGRIIRYGEIASVEASDANSEALYGRSAARLDMPYQSDLTLAGEAAQYFVQLYKDPLTFADRLLLTVPLGEGARLDRILRRRVSDRIRASESVTGVDGSFFINRRTGRLTPARLEMAWLLAPSDATQYWLLEVIGRSELNQTTVLGFGTIVGHTDVAHGDTHSDSAHSDTAHSDTAHGDTHDDVGHTDQGHVDSHSDVAHADTAHSDTHSDTAHSDTAHSDTSHDDSHSDAAHADSHSDIAHSDSHTDAHDDSHNDSHTDEVVEGTHFDKHGDAHTDVAHDDVAHSDTAHDDAHTDTAHSDSHNDAAHSDVAHVDGAHADSHGDTLHADSHTDTHDDAGHGDTAHTDAHTDNAHDDVNHADVGHGDSHSDTAHGDVA